MPLLAIEPLFLSESTLTIGLNDYAAHISGAMFVPSSSAVTFKGLKAGASFTRQTTPTWALTLNYAQDWESAASLSQYLLENSGDTVEMTLAPIDGGQAFTATVTVTPGNIGGEIDTFATTSVTLGVLGQPAKVA
jgi:hypothetical protein